MAYHKELFAFDDGKPIPVIIRNYNADDFEGMIELQAECFPPPFPSELWWNEKQLQNHVSLFPEGAICVESDGELVGSMTALRVQFDPKNPHHTWEEMTDNGYIRNHDPKGNTLYVVDICISPRYRKLKLGQQMMQAMYQTVVALKLERLVGGGRMPGYHRYADRMTAKQYSQAVITGEVVDPVVTFLLRCGRMPLALIENYLDDAESHNYALLMEWKNPFLG
ncbi:GNAT family N-acetyltransferase [Bacillus sp. FJAT-50079]|uniref:GNAT family N-acetyltransferase n=1 Tax=Bacillus sp. FJAT-50079 TaxID=2833577 RepID=UPI001BCA144C|nr:GNAT family N-acetyltransferase [Bacillus sp. FJAT-50079]MBS4207097.1 GNAT family N-acetyltransferase [Bacillus sp. FJAT-50079]